MGDHAPALEARTRCDRQFWDAKLIYTEMFDMWSVYVSKFKLHLMVKKGWSRSGFRSKNYMWSGFVRCKINIYIEMFKMWNL